MRVLGGLGVRVLRGPGVRVLRGVGFEVRVKGLYSRIKGLNPYPKVDVAQDVTQDVRCGVIGRRRM